MAQRREIEDMSGFFTDLTGLWAESSPEIPVEWQISDKVCIGLASGNRDKIDQVAAVLREHGAVLADYVSPPENAIKMVLSNYWNERTHKVGNVDRFRTIKIAVLKCTSAPMGDLVTHAIALDTDVSVFKPFVGETPVPIGRPTNFLGLLQMLRMISGRHLMIKTAATFVDVKATRIMAMEEVNILLKLRIFNPAEYLSKIGRKLIGRVAGAIDFSTPEGYAFIDPAFSLKVSRIWSDRTAILDPVEAQSKLPDYFRGCPPKLIESLIYRGLTAKRYLPFPL